MDHRCSNGSHVKVMTDDVAVILVRHTEISKSWKGLCYGASDVPLSDAGRAAIPALARALAVRRPTYVYHSGLMRTHQLASDVAETANAVLREDQRFAEMNFGAWEGRSWTDIFATVGHDMSQLIHDPDHYAPPDGETAHSMRDRTLQAITELPGDGLSIIVTHGGPISAVRGTVQHLPARDWPGLVPAYGDSLALNRADLAALSAQTHLPEVCGPAVRGPAPPTHEPQK